MGRLRLHQPAARRSALGQQWNRPGRLACDKDLSTPSECWTNCKTEEEITICDIISLDTFWPESPQTKPTKFTGETVKKTVHGRPVVGRVMTAAR